MYFVSSRYYVSEWGRWLNSDAIEFIDSESINGVNLYCYCFNNPIMNYDPSGHLLKWAAWLISGASISTGIALTVATGGLWSIVGGALTGAGAGSLINGYVNEENDGDFTAGYIGGAISGAICGIGAGLARKAFVSASNAVNFKCMKYLVIGVTESFAGGFLGNLAGTAYTGLHESGFKNVDINWGETISISVLTGALNIFAGLGSSMSSIARSVGKVATDLNSKFGLRLLSGLIAGGAEASYDLVSYIVNKLITAL